MWYFGAGGVFLGLYARGYVRIIVDRNIFGTFKYFAFCA